MSKGPDSTAPDRMAYIHLATVYLIWGSTFVAMRAAVMEGSGFTPFVVGATRLSLASILLFVWILFRKGKIKLSRRDFLVTAISGLLIWVGGNGLVMWSEQFVDASYATLIFSTLPLWTIALESLFKRKALSGTTWALFILAFFGMAVLGGEDLLNSEQYLLVPTLVILLSTFLWALSTHLQKKFPISCNSMLASAYQQMLGGIGMSLMALVTHEPWPQPTTKGWMAWSYLVVFGSIIAYTSYVAVIKVFSASISMTFAYVCPVLTVILGYLILDEALTTNKIAGMLIILSSVYFIFRSQRKNLKNVI